MGEISGYNEQAVVDLRDVINNTAQSTKDVIIEELTNGVITPMSTVWYAEEAQEYFAGFAENVKSSGTTIKEVFDGFRANVQKTGEDWAEATGAESTPTLSELDDVVLELNVDAIEAKNAAGDRSLDEDGVDTVIGSLEGVEETIKSRLSGLAQDLDASTAFLGHGQGESVQNCFVKVAESVHKIFEYLLIGDDALEGALSKYKEKYATSAENVASSYDNAEVEITNGGN